MNKKEFIRNRPFDEQDALKMQDWIEESIKESIKLKIKPGVVEGLLPSIASGRTINISPGKAYDNNYNYINVTSQQSVTLDSGNANPRIDVITIKYKRNSVLTTDVGNKYGQGTGYIYSRDLLDSFEIIVIKGTPSSNPELPTIPSENITLSQIYVPANATSIIPEDFRDIRKITYTKPYHAGLNPPENKDIFWIDTN